MLRSIGKQSVESVLAYVLLLFYCLLFFNHFYQTKMSTSTESIFTKFAGLVEL